MADKEQSKQRINHLSCAVETCIYNNQKNECTAHDVKIGPQFATTSNDTACQTYQKQSC